MKAPSAIETESSLPEQKKEPVLTELDSEIERLRCNDVMELNLKFDSLVYYCDSFRIVQLKRNRRPH
jgi:hypothetical protein